MTSIPISLRKLIDGVRARDRASVARAITLVESTAPHDQAPAEELLRALIPLSGNAIRVGITGVPGAGKSTFIERFGLHRAIEGARVAVLAIDPSSPRSGGSILGDKTRMEDLSKHPNCFVRPSPSRGSLGGISQKTREVIVICEAAGFDTIIVETVGVGQSEVAVRSVTDFFILLCITGAGDELQGFKKGVIELADLILVNKADGENAQAAKQLSAELNGILHYLPPSSSHWSPQALPISSLSGEGILEADSLIKTAINALSNSGELQRQRTVQLTEWLKQLFRDEIERAVLAVPEIKKLEQMLTERVVNGNITGREAVRELLGKLPLLIQ
jgi:LAO/AO transport system kinase